MKSLISSLLLFVIPLHSMVAAPPKGQAQVRPVKGLIVVYDGSTLRENSKSFEYSELLQDAQAFKATLPNGASVSGMAGQLVAKVDYERRDVAEMLAEGEKIAALYSKAKPILAIRIPQLRERSILKGNGRDGNNEEVASLNKIPEKSNPKTAGSAPPEAPANSKPQPDTLTGKSPKEIFGSSDADHGSRLNAIMQVAMSPKADDFHLLALAAQGKDSEIQIWGIRGIGKLKSKPSLEKLVEIFRTPELTTTHRKEIVKSIGSFTSNKNPELSLSAVDTLCEIAAEANSDKTITAEATQQLSVCFIEGKEHIRARIESKNFPVVKNVVSQIRQREAQISQREAEFRKAAEAFTIQDRKLLKGYATGGYTLFLSDGTVIPERGYSKGRLHRCKYEIHDTTECARYNLVFRLNGEYQNAQQTLKREQSLLESGDPRQIAMAAWHLLDHLRGVCERTQGDRTRPTELFRFNEVATWGSNKGEVTSSSSVHVGGGDHTDTFLDSLSEINKIRSMFLALSPTAKKQLNLEEPGGYNKVKVESTVETFAIEHTILHMTVFSAGKVGVWMSFARSKLDDRIYDALLANKSLIEEEIGLQLMWKRSDEGQSIEVWHEFGDQLLPQNHAEAQKWLDHVKSRFVNTFRHRIARAK